MPDSSHSHDASYRATVTYGGSGIDFDVLWRTEQTRQALGGQQALEGDRT